MKHPAFSFAVLAVLLLIASVLPCSAKTVYVKWDSPGPTLDGMSWDTAFHNVQAGLDAATSDDEVWVARGTYYGCTAITGKSLHLYGGFSGVETDREQRDWKSNTTELDGGGNGTVVVVQPDWNGEAGDISFTLDGFGIKNGDMSGPDTGGWLVGGVECTYVDMATIRNNAIASNLGGGIGLWYSNATVEHNVITDNTGMFFEVHSGGGVTCWGSSLTVRDNDILRNSAQRGLEGGGIALHDCSGLVEGNRISENISRNGAGIACFGASPTIANNTMTGNSAEVRGGGIYCKSSASTTITSNTITGNNALEGGGGYFVSSSVTISQNAIAGNISVGRGGGLSCFSCSATIMSNVITGNSVPGDGGAICCMGGGPVIIRNNLIAGNISAKYGAAIDCGTSDSTVADNAVTRNSGNGIKCSDCSPPVTNNTVVGNTGAGIECYWSSALISNNIVAFNGTGVLMSDVGDPVLRNNCVYGNSEGNYQYVAPGIGDISGDPLFVDRTNGDYHLKIVSPCVNAGWNDAPGLPSLDMDGESRILYGTVDIGADECSGTAGVLKEAKMVANSIPVLLTGSIVTAAFDGCFYIEAEDRSCGVRVEKAEHGVKAGDKVNVIGVLKTNADGERYIEASSVEVTGTGSIRPVFINSRALGGSDWLFNPTTGAGQCGVVDGLGLNNIGLLVTTWGELNYLGGSYSLDKTAKILAEGMSLGGDTYVRITGISSCYRDTDGLHPTIRVTEIKSL